MSRLTDLADRVHASTNRDQTLEGDIFKQLHDEEGDVWSNEVSGDVWHKRDRDDPAAWAAPPAVLGSVDAAMAGIPYGSRLDALRELERSDIGDADPDWRPWTARLHIAAAFRSVEGRGVDAAHAITEASLRAYSVVLDPDS